MTGLEAPCHDTIATGDGVALASTGAAEAMPSGGDADRVIILPEPRAVAAPAVPPTA